MHHEIEQIFPAFLYVGQPIGTGFLRACNETVRFSGHDCLLFTILITMEWGRYCDTTGRLFAKDLFGTERKDILFFASVDLSQ